MTYMRRLSQSWNINKLNKMYQNGFLSFEYPIQRPSEQWNKEQKSLWIHSLIANFPIPPIYCMREGDIYYVLDGKQRFYGTTLPYLNDEFALEKDTPIARDDDTKEEFVLAGKKFSELSDDSKSALLGAKELTYILEATDDELEEVFYRMNNGTHLSRQQKAKGRMGMDWAIIIKKLIDHPFIKNKCAFTNAQLRRSDDEVAVISTMMLLDSYYELRGISARLVAEYTQTLKGNEDKKVLVDQIKESLDYLDKVFDKPDKVLTKKVNFPMLLITAQDALDRKISPDVFRKWAAEFRLALDDNNEKYPTKYKTFGGQGSVKQDKVLGREKEMLGHFDNYIESVSVENFKEV